MLETKEIYNLNSLFEKKSSFSILLYSVQNLFSKKIAYVCSFGTESAVILHMISRMDKEFPIIFLNTQKLFKETIEYKDTIIKHLSLKNVKEVFPNPKDVEINDPKGFLWKKDPDLCCKLRKVEPLILNLKRYDAWISGRKSYQNNERATKSFVDVQEGKVIISPLINWSQKKINEYFLANNLPRHPLMQEGYLSIGCQNCTVKTSNKSNTRSGRWSGTDKTECGIHFSKTFTEKTLG